MKNYIIFNLENSNSEVIIKINDDSFSVVSYYDSDKEFSQDFFQVKKFSIDNNLSRSYYISEDEIKNSLHKRSISKTLKSHDILNYLENHFDINNIKEKEYWSGLLISSLKENDIFVFGSNPKGRHGFGAAKYAVDFFGAIYGQGRGLQGRSYGLITKNLNKNYYEKSTNITYRETGYKSVKKSLIYENIKELVNFAIKNEHLKFYVAYKNEYNSLNGYKPKEIIELFLLQKKLPDNIIFHDSFKDYIDNYKGEKTKTNKDLDVFDNYYPSKFDYKGNTFFSLEHFLIYYKFKIIKNEDLIFKIMDIKNSNKLLNDFISGSITVNDILSNDFIKQKWIDINSSLKFIIPKHFENENEKTYLEEKERILKIGAREKFKQNNYLIHSLLNTDCSKSDYSKIYESLKIYLLDNVL